MKTIKDRPRVEISENEKASEKINSYLTGDTGDFITYLEEHYPEMTLEFKKIQQEQYKLFCEKQFNYGPSNIAVGTQLQTKDDVKLSLTGLFFRMNDKIQRIKTMVIGNYNDNVEEPLEDSYLDVSNYGIIATIVGRGKWGK